MTDEAVFATLLRQYQIGATVTLTVFRGGTETPVRSVLAAAPRPAREMRRYDATDLGFHARELADDDRNDPRKRDVTRGVVVDGIESGGWAALARLQSGDIILTIDGGPVADIEQLAARIAAASAARRTAIVFKVRRGVRTFFVQLEPVWT
jgi:S1-C subfamily serine protease